MKHLTAATLSDFTNIYFAGFSRLNIAVTENGMGWDAGVLSRF
jgi:hypothetical protein